MFVHCSTPHIRKLTHFISFFCIYTSLLPADWGLFGPFFSSKAGWSMRITSQSSVCLSVCGTFCVSLFQHVTYTFLGTLISKLYSIWLYQKKQTSNVAVQIDSYTPHFPVFWHLSHSLHNAAPHGSFWRA